VGNDIVINAPAPEDLTATQTSYLELRLVVTDADGLQTTVIRNVRPKRVLIRFATYPPELLLKVDGKCMRSPRVLTSWWGYPIRVDAPDQTDADGRRWVFQAWSDGRARNHVIVTPAALRGYRATFR